MADDTTEIFVLMLGNALFDDSPVGPFPDRDESRRLLIWNLTTPSVESLPAQNSLSESGFENAYMVGVLVRSAGGFLIEHSFSRVSNSVFKILSSGEVASIPFNAMVFIRDRKQDSGTAWSIKGDEFSEDVPDTVASIIWGLFDDLIDTALAEAELAADLEDSEIDTEGQP